MLALQGVRVIDWTQWVGGAVAGSMLGDLGADVIKIEERLGGDPLRTRSAVDRKDRTIGAERNYSFEYHNRNKRGIALDLKTERGKEALYRLVRTADVFLHNMRPGVAERLRLDYPTLAKENSMLIYAALSAFGPLGPDAQKPGFDYLASARSGFMCEVEGPGTRPQIVGHAIADELGGTMLAYGVLAALLARDRWGVGQEVQTSLLAGMIWVQGNSVSHRTMLGRERLRASREEAPNPLFNHYQCADGKWLALAMPQADRYWPIFCQALESQEIEKDPRFENIFTRGQHCAELVAILDRIFVSRPREEWVRRFEAADFPFSILNSVHDVESDPQVLANDYVIEYKHPVVNKPVKMVGFPVRFSNTPCCIRQPAPELGQHTEEVLLEIGYTWDDIRGFQDDGVI